MRQPGLLRCQRTEEVFLNNFDTQPERHLQPRSGDDLAWERLSSPDWMERRVPVLAQLRAAYERGLVDLEAAPATP